MSAAKPDEILLGLHLLDARRLPKAEFSQNEIAAWCGCSGQAISYIEKRALRKVKCRMRELRRDYSLDQMPRGA